MKAVVFDMDGLMFDTERLAARGMEAALAKQGFVCDEALFLKMLGLNTEGTHRELRRAFGERFDFSTAMRETDDYIERFITEYGAPVKPGLYELMDRLDAMNLPRAIASGSPEKRILRNIEAAGLSGRFSAVVSADDMPRGKPAPDVFLAAAKALGIDPADCLALEDAPAGVAAAKAAGMKTVMVPDLHAPDETDRAGLCACVGTLFDVIPLLEREV